MLGRKRKRSAAVKVNILTRVFIPGADRHDTLSSCVDRLPSTALAFFHSWESHGCWVGQSPPTELCVCVRMCV